MDRKPVRALNASVSCESIDVPEYQPLIERHRANNNNGETCIEGAAPTIKSVPLTAEPPWTALITSPPVAVARMTLVKRYAHFAPEQLRAAAAKLATSSVRSAQAAPQEATQHAD
jgi:hypothetical protein